MKVYIHRISLIGNREQNQDNMSINMNDNEITVGIYDGHGEKGHIVSSFLKKNFINGLETSDKIEIQSYINNFQLKLKEMKFSQESGSTLLITKINIKEKKLLTINLGDCRILLGYSNKYIQLSNDHKVDDFNERLSLIEKNKNIKYDKNDEMFRVDGYAISRAIGNTNYNSISQQAEINSIKFSKNTNYIIIACDGLWDTLSNNDVNDFITNTNLNKFTNKYKKGKDNIAYLLANKAIKNGSQDNITVAIMFFKY